MSLCLSRVTRHEAFPNACDDHSPLSAFTLWDTSVPASITVSYSHEPDEPISENSCNSCLCFHFSRVRGPHQFASGSPASKFRKIPELWSPVPLEICMKTYLKTNCSFTRNCLPIRSALRNRTAPHLLSGTVYLSNHSGSSQRPFRNARAPRETFVTSTPQAPPQVRYMLIELGGRTAHDISESGQIVGNKAFRTRAQTRRILAQQPERAD